MKLKVSQKLTIYKEARQFTYNYNLDKIALFSYILFYRM